MNQTLIARRAAVLALAAAAACSGGGQAHTVDSTAARATNATRGAFVLPPEQRARIHVVTLQPTSFQPTVEATGTVAFNGDRSTQVLSPISGPATNILVNPGAVVARGAPLATVSSPDFANAVAAYRKSETAYRNLKRIADQDEQLFKNDAIARRDLEQAQSDAASAAADRDAAIEQMRSLGVEESQIDALREGKLATQPQGVIRAPVSGTVVEKLITPGQLLAAGTTPCFTIADLSTMWVMANVFANDIGAVAVGETADVLTDASPTPVKGRVDYVASLVDPGSRAVSVRILASNVGHVLRKDMYVRVAIHAAQARAGILIPATSLLRDENNLPFVFVATADGAFAQRRITLGSRVGDRYEVTAGLNAGDRVVAEGALFLQFAESQ